MEARRQTLRTLLDMPNGLIEGPTQMPSFMQDGTDISENFDLSQALRVLNLADKPPRIIDADLRRAGKAAHGCIWPWAHDRVFVDQRRIEYDKQHGCGECDSCRNVGVESTIAHELVHLAQIRRDGVGDMVLSKLRYDYDSDPKEREARALEPHIAPLIVVRSEVRS